MLIFRLSTLLCVSIFSAPSVLAQVNIIQAPSNFEFVDMGYDPVNDEVGIVGSVINGTERTATVFEINIDGDDFTTQTLADLPGATSNAKVFGISSDATRIAGSSSSENSVNNEGATWLRSSPNSPTGVGFVNGNLSNDSGATGAWADGVVGSSGGGENAFIWDIQNEIQALPGTEGAIAGARDVSSDGEITVGISSHEVFGSAAYYWDNNGINRLDDNIEGFTLFQSIASSISPNGNYIGGEIVATDALGNFKAFPVVWEGTERTLRILTDSNGDFIQGTVNDVSDSGYAVGFYFDASFNSFGFIWNPEFTNGVRLFEEWL